jgi:hypothetical protein
MSGKIKKTLGWTLSVAALLLLGAPGASGAELTRGEYAEMVEPICKTNTEANEKIFEGVRERVKSGELDKAGAQFARAAIALEKTITQLKAVPRPAADEARLRKWFGYISIEATLLDKVAVALRAGNKFKAQSQVLRLNHNAGRANAQVVGFSFNYCRFNPAKFT